MLGSVRVLEENLIAPCIDRRRCSFIRHPQGASARGVCDAVSVDKFRTMVRRLARTHWNDRENCDREEVSVSHNPILLQPILNS